MELDFYRACFFVAGGFFSLYTVSGQISYMLMAATFLILGYLDYLFDASVEEAEYIDEEE